MKCQANSISSPIHRRLFLTVVVTCLVGVCTTAHAAGQPFQKRLDEAVQLFKRKKTTADRYVVRQFGRYRKLIKKDQTLSEATRTEMLGRLDRYTRDFKKNGTFPDIIETVELEIQYQERLNKAFTPVSRLLENELKVANREKSTQYAREILETKWELESTLLSSQPITSGTVFHGTLTRPNGATIPYQLKIDNISDSGDFEGTVEDNPGVGGHWRYRVSGSRTGSLIRFTMSENIRGKLIVVQAEGVVTGNRLIAQLNQKTAKGKGSQNTLLLQR